MSSPLAAFNKFDPLDKSQNWGPASVVALKPSSDAPADARLSAPLAIALGDFKYASDNRDRKLADYLLLGVLSIAIHTSVVDRFKGAAFEQEIPEPPKLETKVQITLARPQPKPVPPPPQVKPKPPAPKVVPLKPQKPKPLEKIVEQAPEPSPVVESAPTAPAPAAPAPVVEEKITAPIAGGDYLNNPQPEYPEIAQERGWEGKVLMKVHVQPDGKPDSVVVIKTSGHDVLDAAAVKIVANKWTFVPAMRGSTPVADYVTVPLSFKLS